MNQIALPASISLTAVDVSREKTLGGAIELCAKVGGYAYDKELSVPLEFDKGQLSRWQSGQEGIIWEKLLKLMDFCGNHAPVLWMLYQLGYDLSSLRKRQTETERLLQISEEKRLAAENEIAVLRKYVGVLK